MGRRGPQKKPVELKLHEGSYRKDRDGPKPAPVSTGWSDGLKTPRNIGEHAAKVWKSLLPLLVETGVLRETDLPAFIDLCRTFQMEHELNQQIEAAGVMISTENGSLKMNPAFTAREQLLTRRIRLLDRFGLNASARASLNLQPIKTKDAAAKAIGARRRSS